MKLRSPFLLPGAVVAVQLALGCAFALRTPPWLNPDEPAHYNYVREVSRTGRLPVLEEGDYDHQSVRRLVDRGFAGAESPDSPTIVALRYESHQPPLYYLAAVPVYRASSGSLPALRVFTVAIGLGTTLLAWAVARRLMPGETALPVAGAALVAFVPQHLAGTAAVNNDTLAELLVAAGLLLCLRQWQEAGVSVAERTGLGLVLGLGLVTKATAYALVPVVVLTHLGWGGARAGGRAARARGMALTLVPALAVAIPWWVRNVMVYGWPDALALLRHGAVVTGQPRAADWIQAHGLLPWLGRGLRVGFQSFWGQLGWMGTVLDAWIYLTLLTVSVLALVGFVAERRRPSRPLRPGGVILAVSAAGTALLAAGYNTVFVQPQGRYLFPALAPFAVAFALGWRRAVQPGVAARARLIFVALVPVLAVWGAARGDLPGRLLLMCGGAAAAAALAARGPNRARAVLEGLPFVALPFLDLWILLRYVGG